jgi:hypothetical protein
VHPRGVALISGARPAPAVLSFPARDPRWVLGIVLAVAVCAVVAFFPGDQAGRNFDHLGPQAGLLRGGLIGVAHNNGDRKPYLMSSTDGATFQAIAGPLTPGDRDPSLTYWDGKYWMAATPLASGSTFDVWYASDPTDAHDWTHTVVDVGAIGTVSYTWAPEWFTDPTAGASYHQVHILFAATVVKDLNGPFRLYETHPLNRAMSAFSTPVEVTGTSLPADQIDPFMVYAPDIGTAGKPYKLWYKQNDSGVIEYMESANLTRGYSVVKSGNWAGWQHGRSIEAICLVRLDDGSWRAYFNENAGLTTVGNFYSDSLDDWATWSDRAKVDTENLMSHGTYIRVASL